MLKPEERKKDAPVEPQTPTVIKVSAATYSKVMNSLAVTGHGRSKSGSFDVASLAVDPAAAGEMVKTYYGPMPTPPQEPIKEEEPIVVGWTPKV